jgi:acetyltransferase-like isoleucine patch superfamily enzyme
MNGKSILDFISLQFALLYTKMIKSSFKEFGEDSIVFPPARIINPCRISIGKGVQIWSGAWLNVVNEYAGRDYNGLLVVDDFCIISHYVQITVIEKIRIGRNVGIGKGCVIADHIHDYRYQKKSILRSPLTDGKQVDIDDDSVVMPNSVIAPGVKIGKHSYIGPNSVVNKDIPDFCLAVGNPATVVKQLNPDTNQWDKVT